jgi:hypothetical protein
MAKLKTGVIEKRHYYNDVEVNGVKYTKFSVKFVDDDAYYYMYKPKDFEPKTIPRTGNRVSFTIHNDTARNVKVIKTR